MNNIIKGLWRRKGRPYWCHMWRRGSNLTHEGPGVREGLGIPWLALEPWETPENPDDSYQVTGHQSSVIREVYKGRGFRARRHILTWLIANKL